MRIPRSITLPGDFKILVKEVPKSQLVGITGTVEMEAAWMSSIQTIYLNNEKTEERRKWDLVHEFGHALVDWLEYLGGLGEPSQEEVTRIKEEFKQQVVEVLVHAKVEEDVIKEVEGL